MSWYHLPIGSSKCEYAFIFHLPQQGLPAQQSVRRDPCEKGPSEYHILFQHPTPEAYHLWLQHLMLQHYLEWTNSEWFTE